MEENKARIIQEYVPGKQVTMAHLIANPVPNLVKKLGLAASRMEGHDAIGVLTISPGEAAIVAADAATKSANISIGFVDRFSGSLLITGDVSAVEQALRGILDLLCGRMKFYSTEITRS